MAKKQQKHQTQTPTKYKQSNEPSELTFLEHIHELRSRLFWVILTIIVASAAGFQYKDALISVVMAPLHGQKLVYLTPGGGFGFIFTLAIYFGVLIAIPIIVYHVYRFLQPLLQRTSRRLVAVFMILSCLLAVGGAAFGYFVTIPAALDFLATFAGDAVTPNLTADSYLNFVVSYILGLALLFQLPLLLFLFDHVRPFPPGSLLSTQRFVIIGATIVAAIITPTPDAFNMAIVAVPIIAIYQLGVVAIYLRHRAVQRSRTKAKPRQQQAPVLTKEILTPIFVGVEWHIPITTAPARVLVPGSSAVSPSTISVRATTVVPHGTVDGFVRPQTRAAAAVSSSGNMGLVTLPDGTHARPVRALDGLSIIGYVPAT